MSNYVQSLILADRVYRLFMESVKVELKRLRVNDINNVQAIMLYNIGKDTLAVGDLIQRKYYLGSNVTYNLRKMGEMGYVVQVQSDFDKRSNYVSLTKKGLELYNNLETVFKKHLDAIKKGELAEFSEMLKEIEINLATQMIR